MSYWFVYHHDCISFLIYRNLSSLSPLWGLPELFYDLFFFLAHLQDHVTCNSSISSSHSLTKKVPQGWSLSPLLFAIYIHTMCSQLNHVAFLTLLCWKHITHATAMLLVLCHCYCWYADDTFLFLPLCFTVDAQKTSDCLSDISVRVEIYDLNLNLCFNIYSYQSKLEACYVSSPHHLTIGVLYSSTLGPLLFILYVIWLNGLIISDAFFITKHTQWYFLNVRYWTALHCIALCY